MIKAKGQDFLGESGFLTPPHPLTQLDFLIRLNHITFAAWIHSISLVLMANKLSHESICLFVFSKVWQSTERPAGRCADSNSISLTFLFALIENSLCMESEEASVHANSPLTHSVCQHFIYFSHCCWLIQSSVVAECIRLALRNNDVNLVRPARWRSGFLVYLLRIKWCIIKYHLAQFSAFSSLSWRSVKKVFDNTRRV